MNDSSAAAPDGPAASSRVPLPWSRSCFVCGESNPHGLRARSWLVGERIEMPFTAREEFAGWNQVIHGGFVATVLDEVMTWAAIVRSERACFAADFTVRLRRPLPPGTDCLAVAWLEGQRRRIFDAVAELRDTEGNVFAQASGRYMVAPKPNFETMRHDFVTAPECWSLERLFRDDD